MTRKTNGLVNFRMVRSDGAIVEIRCPQCSGMAVEAAGTLTVSASGVEADGLRCITCGYAWQPDKVEMK